VKSIPASCIRACSESAESPLVDYDLYVSRFVMNVVELLVEVGDMPAQPLVCDHEKRCAPGKQSIDKRRGRATQDARRFCQRHVPITQRVDGTSCNRGDVHQIQRLQGSMPLRRQLSSHNLGQLAVRTSRTSMDFPFTDGPLQPSRNIETGVINTAVAAIQI